MNKILEKEMIEEHEPCIPELYSVTPEKTTIQ